MNPAFMKEAIKLAQDGMRNEIGGPFGAVVVKDGKIVGKGCNQVTSSNDPTAHAEVVAIRDACNNLGTYQLEDCEVYTSCEPCPMCLGAIYWSRVKRVFFACNHKDASAIGFDDHFIYQEIELPLEDRHIPFAPLMREDALTVFHEWKEKEDKKHY